MGFALFIFCAALFFVVMWALIVGILLLFLPKNHPWKVAFWKKERKIRKGSWPSNQFPKR